MCFVFFFFFFFSSRRRHTRCGRDWSSDVCSSDLCADTVAAPAINSNTISTPARDLVLIFFLSLSYAAAQRPPLLFSIGETGICSIPHHMSCSAPQESSSTNRPQWLGICRKCASCFRSGIGSG